MSQFNEEQLSKITSIVREVEKLNDVERLLLYLRLPGGRAESLQTAAPKTSGAPSEGEALSVQPHVALYLTNTLIAI